MTTSISNLDDFFHKEYWNHLVDNQAVISLLLTKKCNFECAHCMYECGPKVNGRFMSNEIISKVREWIRDLGFHRMSVTINLIGGEPTLFMRKFANVVRYFADWGRDPEYRHDLEMTTNGWWLEKIRTTRAFLDAIRPAWGEIKVRISNDNYHDSFHNVSVSYATLLNTRSEMRWLEVYDDDNMDIPPALDDNWIYVDHHRGNIAVPVGRGYYSGGTFDPGAMDKCNNTRAISLDPYGWSIDGCCYGSNMPFGTVSDNPLVLLLLNAYYTKTVRRKKMSCDCCADEAAKWRMTRDFWRVKRAAISFVQNLE